MQDSNTRRSCRMFDSAYPCYGNAENHSVADTIAGFGRLLTPDELAPFLALSPKTIYSRVRSGSMPAIRIGASIRFDPVETAAWLRSQAA
jgi:excisionase family DNA binding protein